MNAAKALEVTFSMAEGGGKIEKLIGNPGSPLPSWLECFGNSD